MKDEKNHILVTEYNKQSDLEDLPDINWKVEPNEILCDIKFLLREYYVATFGIDEKSLILGFNNGQKFKITVSEIRERI